jgi:phage shock protein PspC (stress-responsive transcriptional regulator)
VWLGVCAYNAERFGMAPWMLRLALVVLGVFTGPVAAFVYLAGFAEYYWALEEEARPRIHYGTLALRTIAPLAVVLLLRWATFKLLDLLAYGYDRVFSEPVPPLGKWDWLAHYEGTVFFLVCISVLPLSVLSGMPLANAWSHSLKRLAQALVALYFVALSFGVASILVGIILDRVQPYMQ